MAAPLAPVLQEAVRGRVADAAAVLGAWHQAHADARTHTAALIASPAVSRALRRAGALEEAVELCSAADAGARGPELRAMLLQSWQLARMARGDAPDHDEVQEVARQLCAVSDERFAEDKHASAAKLLFHAWELLLDRSLHTEGTDSPLAHDAAAWVRPLRDAAVSGWLEAARRPRRWRPRRRPRRVLLVTATGSSFLEQPRRLAAEAGLELRELVLTDLQGTGWLLPRGPALAALRVAARTGEALEVPPALAESYAWADQVLVDWCDDGAAYVSATLPRGPELVIRLHSVEALSVQPHFVTWERVDRLAFVCDHVRRLLAVVVPRTAAVPSGLLPPHAPGAPLRELPPRGPDRVVAVVGWSQPVKDPVWALDVLAELRRTDPSWRLLLVGRDQLADPPSRHGLAEYARRWAERLAQPDVAGAVDRLEWLDDVTRLNEHASVILSSSVREGYAVGLHEGVEAGLLPVVRRWPIMAPFGAPGETCDPEWVVDAPEQAADRVLRQHADDAARERAWRWLDEHLGARAVTAAYRRELRWPLPTT